MDLNKMQNENETVISMSDVRRVYKMGESEVHALRGISFDIRQGEFVAIMGPSGSGKSTCMNMIGCLDRPTSGVVAVGGKETAAMNEKELARLRNFTVGFVFQQYHLIPSLTVAENVMLPLRYQHIEKGERLPLARAALEKVSLTERMNHRPHELSGGQKQRVAIARALVTQPKIILADEPTGALDSETGRQVMELFNEINAAGTTIVIVTHDPRIGAAVRRCIHIFDGKILADNLQTPVPFTGESADEASPAPQLKPSAVIAQGADGTQGAGGTVRAQARAAVACEKTRSGMQIEPTSETGNATQRAENALVQVSATTPNGMANGAGRSAAMASAQTRSIAQANNSAARVNVGTAPAATRSTVQASARATNIVQQTQGGTANAATRNAAVVSAQARGGLTNGAVRNPLQNAAAASGSAALQWAENNEVGDIMQANAGATNAASRSVADSAKTHRGMMSGAAQTPVQRSAIASTKTQGAVQASAQNAKLSINGQSVPLLAQRTTIASTKTQDAATVSAKMQGASDVPRAPAQRTATASAKTQGAVQASVQNAKLLMSGQSSVQASAQHSAAVSAAKTRQGGAENV